MLDVISLSEGRMRKGEVVCGDCEWSVRNRSECRSVGR